MIRKVGKKNWGSAQLIEVLKLLGAIVGTVSAGVFILQEGCLKPRDRWNNVDQRINRLIQAIKGRDKPIKESPTRDASRSVKLKFIRDVQALVHPKSFQSISPALLELREADAIELWEEAIVAHGDVERVHPTYRGVQFATMYDPSIPQRNEIELPLDFVRSVASFKVASDLPFSPQETFVRAFLYRTAPNDPQLNDSILIDLSSERSRLFRARFPGIPRKGYAVPFPSDLTNIGVALPTRTKVSRKHQGIAE